MAAIGRFQKGDEIFYAKVVDGELYRLHGDVFGSPSFDKKRTSFKGLRTLPPVSPTKVIAVGEPGRPMALIDDARRLFDGRAEVDGAAACLLLLTPAAADHITVYTQPGNGVNGQALSTQPVVKALDPDNNLDTNYGGVITNGAGVLSLTKNGAGTLTLVGTTDNAWLSANVNGGNLVLAKQSGTGFKAIGGTSAGAPIMRSSPCWFSGKRMTSRMLGSSASSMTIRSMPGAEPPCGGAP